MSTVLDSELPHLDAQVARVERSLAGLVVPAPARRRIPSTVYQEIRALPEDVQNRFRLGIAIPPEDYLDEMASFQSWMDFAHSNHGNPVVVRAQVMTQLYVGFLWLRDSLLDPIADVVPDHATTAVVIRFLRSADRRRLRNAVAHGRWHYLPDFSGLECWDGRPLARFVVDSSSLNAWQLLSRGTTIAALLALADA